MNEYPTQQQYPPLPRKVNYNPPPQSDLDFNMRLTDNVWGSDQLHPELRELLTREYVMRDSEGTILRDAQDRPLISRESLAAIHGFYTRDLRLGNLDKKTQEFEICQYNLDLAADMLKEGFFTPFMICLSRALNILELSQSRGGFLRKEINTLRSEQKQELVEPPKKSLFGKPQDQR